MFLYIFSVKSSSSEKRQQAITESQLIAMVSSPGPIESHDYVGLEPSGMGDFIATWWVLPWISEDFSGKWGISPQFTAMKMEKGMFSTMGLGANPAANLA